MTIQTSLAIATAAESTYAGIVVAVILNALRGGRPRNRILSSATWEAEPV